MNAAIENNKDYQTALRTAIKRRMELGGMSKDELAKAAGMRGDYLGHVLSGRRPVSVETQSKLVPWLCTTVDGLNREAKRIVDGGK